MENESGLVLGGLLLDIKIAAGRKRGREESPPRHSSRRPRNFRGEDSRHSRSRRYVDYEDDDRRDYAGHGSYSHYGQPEPELAQDFRWKSALVIEGAVDRKFVDLVEEYIKTIGIEVETNFVKVFDMQQGVSVAQSEQKDVLFTCNGINEREGTISWRIISPHGSPDGYDDVPIAKAIEIVASSLRRRFKPRTAQVLGTGSVPLTIDESELVPVSLMALPPHPSPAPFSGPTSSVHQVSRPTSILTPPSSASSSSSSSYVNDSVGASEDPSKAATDESAKQGDGTGTGSSKNIVQALQKLLSTLGSKSQAQSTSTTNVIPQSQPAYVVAPGVAPVYLPAPYTAYMTPAHAPHLVVLPPHATTATSQSYAPNYYAPANHTNSHHAQHSYSTFKDY
eukprot:c15544_g1_i1.p1 GENE.c15544_g1_i1~~c15544_g1_i1.p1  ORF type:complete len:463 (+),score=41.31 c15544_g1_i1:209-1390(+)